MTRISATIKPKELCDQMLIAEHREIVRVPNMIKSGKAKFKNIPDEFTLGKGHVKFFYNKVYYLYKRYINLRRECIRRGFNVSDFSSAFSLLPDNVMNDWDPDKNIVRPILIERINIRLKSMKLIRYEGIAINYKTAKLK